MKKIMLLMLIMILGLQGCNSESTFSKKEDKLPAPPVFHAIQPNEIAHYIEEFKLAQAELKFEFNHQVSKISFVDDDIDNQTIIAKYDLGLVYIGFDFDNNTAIKSIELREGDTSKLEEEEFKPTRILTGVGIEVTEDGNNLSYAGSVEDDKTGNMYPISIRVNDSLLSGGNSKLVIAGDKAILSGILGTSTYIQIQDMIRMGSVDTLILKNIDGSMNDDINVHTGRLIRKAKLTTLVPKDSWVYSGGVDLFSAGSQRIYQGGAEVGVHSWCCTDDGKDAGQLSKDNKAHGVQLTYFREMLGAEKGPEFYFYTINAAPANKIHLMSVAHMVKYTLTTS